MKSAGNLKKESKKLVDTSTAVMVFINWFKKTFFEQIFFRANLLCPHFK